jgi:hypothetical protein
MTIDVSRDELEILISSMDTATRQHWFMFNKKHTEINVLYNKLKSSLDTEIGFNLNNIIKMILEKFPHVHITTENEPLNNGTFIKIDNKKIYYSIEYQQLIVKILQEILWPNNIHNVYFSYEEN